jgi:hypothetical protein
VVYCSREEELVYVDGNCKDCGDEEVGKSEAYHPEKIEKLEEGYSSTSTEGGSSTGKNYKLFTFSFV